MLKKLAFAVLFVLGLAAAPAEAQSQYDFTLVNKTGYGIKEVYVAPTASDEWGDNILSETLENNEELAIEFHPKANAAKWDLMITWVDGGDSVYWRGYKLAEVNKITLKYDRAKGTTSAVTE